MLDRTIPTDDSHTVITEGKTYSIELIPKNNMTFRVPCKNANSPAKFFISFDTNSRTGGAENDPPGMGGKGKFNLPLASKDLQIFVSQEEKEPKEGHNENSYFCANICYKCDVSQ